MDARVTLCFDKVVIDKAKRFAERNNISLSRLTEFLLTKITTKEYAALDEIPVSEWVTLLAEGETEYHTKSRKRATVKKEYYKSRK